MHLGCSHLGDKPLDHFVCLLDLMHLSMKVEPSDLPQALVVGEHMLEPNLGGHRVKEHPSSVPQLRFDMTELWRDATHAKASCHIIKEFALLRGITGRCEGEKRDVKEGIIFYVFWN